MHSIVCRESCVELIPSLTRCTMVCCGTILFLALHVQMFCAEFTKLCVYRSLSFSIHIRLLSLRRLFERLLDRWTIVHAHHIILSRVLRRTFQNVSSYDVLDRCKISIAGIPTPTCVDCQGRQKPIYRRCAHQRYHIWCMGQWQPMYQR